MFTYKEVITRDCGGVVNGQLIELDEQVAGVGRKWLSALLIG